MMARRIIVGIVRVVAAVYAILLALVWGCANSMMFHPPQGTTDGPEIRKLVTRSGRKISAAYLPNPEAEFTLLFSHGNAEDLGTCQDFLQEARRGGTMFWGTIIRGTAPARASRQRRTLMTTSWRPTNT